MKQIAHSTKEPRPFKPAAVPATAAEGDVPKVNTSVTTDELSSVQPHFVIELGIALGKTIEARASQVSALDATPQSAATIVADVESNIYEIYTKHADPSLSKIYKNKKNYSEYEVARIREIYNRLKEPLFDHMWRDRKGILLDREIPIDLMASDLAALAAFTCDWAISVTRIGNVPSILERRLTVIMSLERYIIERANCLIEAAVGLTRLRNPDRQVAVIDRTKALIEDIREASRSLADESSRASSLLPTFSPITKPRKVKNWSRLPVYHGTSGTNLKQILKEGCLRASAEQESTDYVKVSLTLDRSVAEYFACQAAFRDTNAPEKAEINAVVLELDGHGLAAMCHELNAGEVDWQRELVCCESIDQLDRVLIGSELVPPERFADYLRLDRKAFMPTSEFKPDDALWIRRLILQDQAKSAPKWWS